MKHPHNKSRLKECLDGIVAGKYKQTQVAMWTNYSREHICRLTKRYKKEGSSCLVNGHKGRPGPRAIPQEVKDKIVNIYRRDFVAGGKGTQFTVFRGCLEELYGISYSYRAVYNVLTAAGIQSPEKRRVRRERAHRPRQRKASGAGVVSYMNHKLLVRAPCACRKVELCIFKDAIRALYKGRFYDVELVEEPKGRSHAPEVLREIIAKTLKIGGKTGCA